MKTAFFPSSLLVAGCALALALTSACESTGAGAAAPELSPVDPVAQAMDLSGWNVSTGDSGVFDLAWRPVGGAVTRNEVVDLEVMLLRDGHLLPGPQVRVRGWMPDHSHGLVRTPLVTSSGDGHHQVEGVLLHMRGLWQLMFDVTDGKQTDCVTFELTL